MIVYMLRSDYITALEALVSDRLTQDGYIWKDPAKREGNGATLSVVARIGTRYGTEEVQVWLKVNGLSDSNKETFRLEWDNLSEDANHIAHVLRYKLAEEQSPIGRYTDVLK